MYTLFVTLDVHPDKVDEFVDAICQCRGAA